MQLVTVMNYTDPQAIRMCLAWLRLARRAHPDAPILIYHRVSIPAVEAYARRFEGVELHRFTGTEKEPDFPPCVIDGVDTIGSPGYRIKFAMIDDLEQRGLERFVYVDADALILKPLDALWAALDDQPFVAVQENHDPRFGPVFNAGMFACSQPGFVGYDLLLDQYARDGNRILIPAGEQGLMNRYLQRIGYDFRHPAVGAEYNFLADRYRVEAASDAAIDVYDDPDGERPWWNEQRLAPDVPVRILHGYAMNKFWERPTSLWWYCLSRIPEDLEALVRAGAMAA